MIEHVSEQQIERYRQRSMSVEEFLRFDDHLSECEQCRARASHVVGAGGLIETLQADFASESSSHLAYEQLADYVDGCMDETERKIADAHLSHCRDCSTEARDLQSLSAQIAASTVQSPPALHSFRDYWRNPWVRLPIQFAGAAAVIALIFWAATLPLRRENELLRTQLALAEQKNEDLEREYEIARAEAEALQSQAAQVQIPQDSITINDGALLSTIDNSGKIDRLESLPPAFRQMVKYAFETGRAKTPQAIEELAGRAGALMSGSKEGVKFALLSPVGTVVTTSRPTFRWQGVEGADSYSVAVFDENFNLVAQSPALVTPAWTMTSGLERGRVYEWQVMAKRDGEELKSPLPPAPEARFKVLEKEKVQEVIEARKNYPDSRLIAGLVYAQAGLLDEAEREFQSLARNNPDSSLAKKLLSNVRALRKR